MKEINTFEEFKNLAINTELDVDCNNTIIYAYDNILSEAEIDEEDSNLWYKVDDYTIGFSGSHKCHAHYKDVHYFLIDTPEGIPEPDKWRMKHGKIPYDFKKYDSDLDESEIKKQSLRQRRPVRPKSN